MNMRIEYKEPDIDFVAEFEDRLCLLYMTSGDGKTLLFRTFNKALYEDWHYNYYYYDYTAKDKILGIMDKCTNPNNIIIFDNADLYTGSVLKVLEVSKATIVVITKSLDWLGIYEESFGHYYIEHTPDCVAMRKMK